MNHGRLVIDWADFHAHAARARSLDGAKGVREGVEALRLVRGRVLEAPGWHGIDRTVWQIEAEIDRFAGEVATAALGAGLPAEAAEVESLGQRAVPGSPGLWKLHLAAAEAGSGERPATIAARAEVETGVAVGGPG